mgnify:CR=1 FL=1
MRTRSSVLQLTSLHRHVVNKGAVETLEIEDDKLLVFLVYLRMAAGDGSVGDAESGRSVATNNDRRVFNREDIALQPSGNGSQSPDSSESSELWCFERPSVRALSPRRQ